MRSPRTATKSSPRFPQLEKAHAQQRRPNTAKSKLKKKKRLCDSNAGGVGLIPGQGIRSYMSHGTAKRFKKKKYRGPACTGFRDSQLTGLRHCQVSHLCLCLPERYCFKHILGSRWPAAIESPIFTTQEKVRVVLSSSGSKQSCGGSDITWPGSWGPVRLGSPHLKHMVYVEDRDRTISQKSEV